MIMAAAAAAVTDLPLSPPPLTPLYHSHSYPLLQSTVNLMASTLKLLFQEHPMDDPSR